MFEHKFLWFIVFRQGSAGGETTFNDICLLPKNIIIQHFYRIWFVWLIFLAIVTSVMMIIRLAIIFDAKTRDLILRHRYNGKKESTVNICDVYYIIFFRYSGSEICYTLINDTIKTFISRRILLLIVDLVTGWCWLVSWTTFPMCLDRLSSKFWTKNYKEKCLRTLLKLTFWLY